MAHADDESDVSEIELTEEDLLGPLKRSPRTTDASATSYESEPDLLGSINLSGANSWQDVDREQLSATVLKLISSVASTAPADDKSRDAVWHPLTTVTVNQDIFNDPLGFGTIDLANMRLDRATSDEGQAGPGTPTARKALASSKARKSAQGKGAVGRFFSELTRQQTLTEAHPSQQPSSTPALSAAGAAGQATMAGRNSSSKPSSGAGGKEQNRGMSVAGGLPQVKLLPSEEGFDPEAYLAIFHETSSAAELADGLRALEKELGERTGQLKQLVKQNFERFISCKTTIDDIYVKLQHIESTKTGISTEILYNAIQEVQQGASNVFSPILERSAKAERIRSVQLLLRRFQGLFSAPQRIRALAAARDYEQVTAEFKKANALIKPGPKTANVWANLYAEIEKRVADVYSQLQTEIQDPHLQSAAASELVIHMLQLQAEGLAAAQGQDPLALLLAARERQFAAAMQTCAAEHERAVGRLRAAIAAAATDDKLQQDPASITELQLLQCTATSWHGSSSHPGTAAAAASLQGVLAACSPGSGYGDLGLGLRRLAAGGVAGLPGSRHLADVAPLSGLQPPAPRSRLVQHTRCTAGEMLYLRYLQRQSEVLLECLPGLWQAAGSNKLQLPVNLPASAASKLQTTLAGAANILQRLVSTYCKEVGGLVAALASVGPLREALLIAAEELAYTVQQLEAQRAPQAALEAVQGTLSNLIAAGVQQLVSHLHAVPTWLIAREAWHLSLTHSGSQPITMMPEQLQEEITAAMQYYQQLLNCCNGTDCSTAGAVSMASTAASRFVTPDMSTKPVRDAYFTCLEDTIKTCKAAADELSPTATAAASAGSSKDARSSRDPAAMTASKRSGSSSSPLRGRQGMSVAAAAAVLGPDILFDDLREADSTGAAAASQRSSNQLLPGAVAAACLGPGSLSDDVRLLLMSSNLSFMRERLVGSLTQRFLLVLTGEVASEVDRCSRYVVKLAGRLDSAIQAVHGVYLERKRRSIDRLLSNYIKPDGQPVGIPPDLKDVSPYAQQLVQFAAAVQSETFTYARPFMQQLLHASLEHLGGAMSTAFASLPNATAGTASAAAAGGAVGCPVEALGQYFMDLVYLDAILSKAGPAALSVDLTAAYQLLATRMCAAAAGATARSAAETPLARSVLAIKEPQELSRRLQVTCRKALRDILERSSFTVRSLLGAPAAATIGNSSRAGVS